MISNFQVMRAVAALLVTFVHIDIFAAGNGLTERDLAFGNVGVDLFFVLSGFVITHSAANSRPSAGRFIINRIIRVAPIYWLLTVGVYVVAIISPQLLNATTADPIELAKSLLFIPYMKSNGLIQPVLFVGWTLNYEMFFYIIFAIFLAFTQRRLTATVIGASIFIIAFTLIVAALQPESLVLRFFGYGIVLEFVFGMWIGLAAQRWPAHASPIAWPVLIAGAMCLLLLPYHLYDAPRWLVAGVPAGLILWAALMLERRGWRLTNRTAQLLGASSYALYLSHPFVLQGLGKAFQQLEVPQLGMIAGLVSIGIAHLVGIALHLHVERPMTQWLKRKGERRDGPAAVIVVPPGER